MDRDNIFTSEPSNTQTNDFFEVKNTNDESSWFIENDIKSDNINSTASNNDLFENDEHLFPPPPPSSSSNVDLSDNDEQVPSITASLNHPFEYDEQIYKVPPTAEELFADHLSDDQSDDKSSFNIFSNEDFVPLQAINKQREEEINAKDVEEKQKIAVLREQAKTDLENWYNERQRQLQQKFQTIKTEENDLNTKSLEKSSKQICDWSKVIRFIDFTDGKQLTKSKRDLTRMKECIFNAKRISDKAKLANGN